MIGPKICIGHILFCPFDELILLFPVEGQINTFVLDFYVTIT